MGPGHLPKGSWAIERRIPTGGPDQASDWALGAGLALVGPAGPGSRGGTGLLRRWAHRPTPGGVGAQLAKPSHLWGQRAP